MNEAMRNKNQAGLMLVGKPVQRVEQEQGLREGSTGRIVFVPAVVAKINAGKLHRVWAVAE